MIPILFDSVATTFTTNGIGRLTDALSCVVTEERNGIYELEMEYLSNGILVSEIKYLRIIVCKVPDSTNLQAFRIYKIRKLMKGKITIYAEHISYQLNFIPCEPFTANSLANALENIEQYAVEDCPFEFITNIQSSVAYNLNTPKTIKNLLGGSQGSLLDVYGGEYKWDNYTVQLLSERGVERDVVLRYGVNIIDLKQEENIASVYTGVLPFWSSEDESAQTVIGDIQRADTHSLFPFERTIIKDYSQDFQDPPTKEDLETKASAYVRRNSVGIPVVNINVSFLDLSLTNKLPVSLSEINLCDTIQVIFEKFNISRKAKVVKIVYNVLKERYDNIEVGTIKTTLSQTINKIIDTHLSQ